jgi:glycosyltransferase involved in cell wall biosynthesis
MDKPRIAFVVNHAAFFVSHRLPIAVAARLAGYTVKLFTGQAGSLAMESIAEKRLQDESIEHKRSGFSSSGLNPLVEGFGLFQLLLLIIKYRPDIIHCASPKGVLYGGLVARVCRVKGLVIAISGMGYTFTTNSGSNILRKTLKSVYGYIFSWILRHPNIYVIVQNRDDKNDVLRAGSVKDNRVVCMPGSGIPLEKYITGLNKNKEAIVLFPARMLRDKGIEDFVEAARIVKLNVVGWRFIAAGTADYMNPSAVSIDVISGWVDEGVIEWLGHVIDMVQLFQRSAIVCLPSYREGFPKSLIEAAASGCAVVTTDVIGCRDAIYPGVTGDLVPVRDPRMLAEAILRLIEDNNRRDAYGSAGVEMAKERFSVNNVIDVTISIYRFLLCPTGKGG